MYVVRLVGFTAHSGAEVMPKSIMIEHNHVGVYERVFNSYHMGTRGTELLFDQTILAVSFLQPGGKGLGAEGRGPDW